MDYNYDRNKYTLTIDPNGGTYTDTTSQELKYEQSITLTNPTKTGYNFTNWTTTSGSINGLVFTIEANDATVTANYTPKQYTVTFNANGGSTPTSSKTVTYASTYGTLPTPTYTGYTFLGWFTASSGGTQKTSSSIVSITDNQTLFAQWKKEASTEATLEALKITPKSGNPTFANAATTDEGVYSMADNYGPSYYYRGAVTNNYIKFGGIYWRIIRINGNGSVRMIYDGTQAYANAGGGKGSGGADRYTHTGKAWNANNYDAKYVGWMFGGADGSASTQKDGTTSSSATYNQTDSDLKELWVDPWYKTNIVDKKLGKYISDEIFCNDRTTPGSSATGWTNETGKGFGTNATAYGGTSRLGGPWKTTVTQPTFICPKKNDTFTVSNTTKGNGSLTYPVGLITADEIVAAGSGKYGTSNKYYYLYKNSSSFYWSLSPHHFSGSYAKEFVIETNGALQGYNVTGPGGAVAPVINISPEYAATITGEGSMTSPYKIPGVE